MKYVIRNLLIGGAIGYILSSRGYTPNGLVFWIALISVAILLAILE